MQRERGVGLGKAREQAVREHRLGARDGFFGGLADEHQRAFPLVLERDQRARGAEPAGHVDVVAAAVGHEAVAPAPVGAGLTGVGQAGLLFHREAVHVGAHHHDRPGAVAVQRHDAGAADLLGHLEADGAHLGGEQGGGARFLESKLGVGVQVLVEGVEPGVHRIDERRDRRRLRRCGGLGLRACAEAEGEEGGGGQ
ncbi:hypothetical protein J2W27_005173 [Variovorax boronicumulans]|nr:hypothetical protein [Variovorax boronicumulans]